MTILFYSPFNQRSRDTESLILAFQKKGYRVISLSQAEGRYIHPFLQSNGIEVFTHVIKRSNDFIYYLRHLAHFIFFCYQHKVNVVYAHLEAACLVASMGQFFITAKVFICRHHIDEAALQGFDKSIYYRLTYRLARNIIVVSGSAVKYMINVEGISGKKITKINLAYNFDLYEKPDKDLVKKIRSEYNSDVLLLTAGRLTKYKRFELSIEIVRQLVSGGMNAKLLLLGAGEERDNLLNLVSSYRLSHHVILLGFVHNVIDYLAACDYLLHPSILESSCVIVKEAGLVSKPIIVCKGVGDFEDYIQHGHNGFLVDKTPSVFIQEAIDIINSNLNNSEYLHKVGRELKNSIQLNFGIDHVFDEHIKLLRN
jgi:glycosyltransferase involved in cell wall biosynthesis